MTWEELGKHIQSMTTANKKADVVVYTDTLREINIINFWSVNLDWYNPIDHTYLAGIEEII